MKYFFAPLEGITGYIYRQAHHDLYPGMDRYYTPFIVPKEKKYLNAKEHRDVRPEHNKGMTVIPQILTNRSEEFLRVSYILCQEYGYQEINLNLGCPSKTVVSKKRGSGFLAVPDQLEAFLEEVCDGLARTGMHLSIKTRIGKKSPEEFSHLLEIFRRFPLSELIVHPRIQADFYNNMPDLQAFMQACDVSKNTEWELCYNGNLFGWSDYHLLSMKYPEISAVMMGRGLLMNPGLAEEIKVRENGGYRDGAKKPAVLARFACTEDEKAERRRRYALHQRLLEDYMAVMCGEKNVLFKMKELWMYMCQDFTEPQKYWKKMKKAQNLSDFKAAVKALCEEQQLCETSQVGLTSTKK